MNKEHTLTKISLGIDAAAVLVLVVYFVFIAPYPPIIDLGGLLILSPPLFGIFGLASAIFGLIRTKTRLGVTLIILNVIFLFWWPIIWIGGTLLLGP